MTVDDLMAVQPVIPVITIERVGDAIPWPPRSQARAFAFSK